MKAKDISDCPRGQAPALGYIVERLTVHEGRVPQTVRELDSTLGLRARTVRELVGTLRPGALDSSKAAHPLKLLDGAVCFL